MISAPPRRSLAGAAAGVVALLAGCSPPPTQGVYLHRERYGAIILDLDDPRSGRVAGTIAMTRLGAQGGIRVLSRKLTGTRDGDIVSLRDSRGDRFAITLTDAAARVTAPDGGVLLLERADAKRQGALLADLAAQAQGLAERAGGDPARHRSGAP